MQFRSELNRPKPHMYAQKESKFKKYLDSYEDVINEKTGKWETIITDKIPVDDKIQEAKDSVALESILNKYKVDLNKKVLKEVSEDITDMTIMPQDALEAYAMIDKARKNFNDTNAEFKKEFNNNFGEYLAGFKNGKSQEVINKYNKKLSQHKHAQAQVQQAPVQPAQQVQQQVQQTPAQQVQQQVQQNIQNTINGGITNV